MADPPRGLDSMWNSVRRRRAFKKSSGRLPLRPTLRVDRTSQYCAVQGRFPAPHPELYAKRVLLFLGRLHSCNNLTFQLDAFALLAKRHTNLACVPVKPDGGTWRRLSSEVNRLALKDRVFWMG